MPSSVRLIPDSAFGYEIHIDGHIIGHVGKGDRAWIAKTIDFNLGEHPTRRDAVEGVVDVYST